MEAPVFERKSDQVRRLVQQGDLKAALRIAKEFRLGIEPRQRSQMQYAYECMVHPEFYVALGIDPAQRIKDGLEVLKGLYG